MLGDASPEFAPVFPSNFLKGQARYGGSKSLAVKAKPFGNKARPSLSPFPFIGLLVNRTLVEERVINSIEAFAFFLDHPFRGAYAAVEHRFAGSSSCSDQLES